MSEHIRISTPLSASPGRSVTVHSRPIWPWDSQAYPLRSSHSSIHSTGSAPGLGSQSSWDSRTTLSSNNTTNTNSTSWSSHPIARQSSNLSMGFASTPEDTTRQWTFTGFEWVVRDVHKLRDFVEGQEQNDNQDTSQASLSHHDDFEILKESPMLGDGKFKLEIASTPLTEGTPNASQTLSLYITCLMVDLAHAEYEMPTSMMTAIKCQDDRIGERGARVDWVWEFWQHDWIFRQESEVWECPLPSLSTLLSENPRIRESDSLVICVQIHCPFGPSFPQQPSVYYVPRDLLDGLEASLDNPNTGDVRFVCLERLGPDMENPSMLRSPGSGRSSSSSSFPIETTARKRIIYAHADILTRRSEYFATMLASSFAENQPTPTPGERKVFTIVVEEADFTTIFWLLKYCYANWLLFKESDDPRAAVDGIGAGWSVSWLNGNGNEWDWQVFRKTSTSDDDSPGDARSMTSGDSLRSSQKGSGTSSHKSKSIQGGVTPTASPMRSISGSRPSPSSSKASPSSPRQPLAGTRRTATLPSSRSTLTTTTNTTTPHSVSRSKPVPISLSVPKTSHSPPTFQLSPRSQRHHIKPNTLLLPDPHLHPAPAPPPASALSMYQVAHRYAMPALANLALEHMMSTISPQSSFALLLATSVWDELHSLVEDYIVDKWDEVSVSDEFEKCCQEVAAGEWGAEGGKTLMVLFRRLRSPNALVYGSRT